jgi:hypothetical protein
MKGNCFFGCHDVMDVGRGNMLLVCHPEDGVIERGVNMAFKKNPLFSSSAVIDSCSCTAVSSSLDIVV